MPVPKQILYLTEADVQQTLNIAEAVDLAEKGIKAAGAGKVTDKSSVELWRRRR